MAPKSRADPPGFYWNSEQTPKQKARRVWVQLTFDNHDKLAH